MRNNAAANTTGGQAPRLLPGAEVHPLTPERVRAGLSTRLFGQTIRYHPRVGSTNDLAREQAEAGAPEGLLVLAEEQTAGRGRQGRRWEAPFGSSLLCSLLLRPTFLPPERAFSLTILACLAVARAVERETGLRPELKWPNDLLLGGRKVCGILVELGGAAGRMAWAVLGWGLNVNVDFRATLLEGTATSLAAEAGRPLERLPLLRACLEALETGYEKLRSGGESLLREWRGRLVTLGRPVEVVAPEGHFSGRALDVDAAGALLVERADGRVARVLAGDVSVREEGHGMPRSAGSPYPAPP